jgi:hypothetical protein
MGGLAKHREREDKYMIDEAIGFAIGCAVIPAAVAISQAKLNGPVSGAELLTAISLGVDLEARLVRAIGLGFVPGRTATTLLSQWETMGPRRLPARSLDQMRRKCWMRSDPPTDRPLETFRARSRVGVSPCGADSPSQWRSRGKTILGRP